MSPASGCSSRAWPSSCASTPATSSGELACCTRPRVRMICPPGAAKALTSCQSSSSDAHGRGLSRPPRRGAGELSSAALLGGRFAHFCVLGQRGDDGVRPRTSRVCCGMQAGDGLGRMQVEHPHGCRRAPPPSRPRTTPGRRPCQRWRAWATGRAPVPSSDLAEGGVGNEQGLRAWGSRLSSTSVASLTAAARRCAARRRATPRVAALALGAQNSKPAAGEADSHGRGVSRPAVAQLAGVERCASEGIDIERLRKPFAALQQGVRVLPDRAATAMAPSQRQPVDDVARRARLGDRRRGSRATACG